MSFARKLVWHDYQHGRVALEEFEKYVNTMLDQDWKQHILERIAKEKKRLSLQLPPTSEPASQLPEKAKTTVPEKPDGTNPTITLLLLSSSWDLRTWPWTPIIF